MPNLGNLTEADIRRELPKSFKRGYNYLNRVKNPSRAGETLLAQVQGGYLYEVEVTVRSSGISSRCTCSWGGSCKHVAAVLLKWIQAPNSFAAAEAPVVLREQELEVIPVQPPPTRRPKDLPGWMRLSFDDRRQAERRQLYQWLDQIPLQDLRVLAKDRGWLIKGKSKQVVIEQIAEQMTNPEIIRDEMSSLDAEHQRVLYAMILAGYSSVIKPEHVERIARMWGELTSHKQVETYMAHLRDMGLAIHGCNTAHQAQDLVPDMIARHLMPALDALVRKPATHVATLPVLADPYPFVRAANQIALLLEQSPVTLRPPMPRPQFEKFYPALQHWDYDPTEVVAAKQSRQLEPHGYLHLNLTVPPPRDSLPDEAIQRLAPIAGDAARLEFIYALLVASGLLQPGSPVTIWQEVKERFLRADEITQRAILARSYFTMPNWSEMWNTLRAGNLQLRRTGGYGDYKPAQLRNDLVGFRWMVLRALACLPDDQWIALEDVCRILRVILPRFDGGVWSLYYGAANAAWFLSQASSDTPLEVKDELNWDLAQGNFIRQIIAGPLHWLGLADLGQEGDQLIAFRLHGLGDLYWDRVEALSAPHHAAAPSPTAQDAGKVLATEGHTITVNPSAINAQAHGLLDKMAHLDVATAQRFVYRLDAEAVYRSFEAGTALSDLVNDWERLLPVSMPEAIRTQLTEWWVSYGRIRIYENLAVIELGDDYALAEIKAATSLEQHLFAEISPRLVIVSKDAIATLTAELEKAGYTPKQTSDV